MDYVRVLVNGVDQIVISNAKDEECYQIDVSLEPSQSITVFVTRDELVELKAKMEVFLDNTR